MQKQDRDGVTMEELQFVILCKCNTTHVLVTTLPTHWQRMGDNIKFQLAYPYLGLDL